MPTCSVVFHLSVPKKGRTTCFPETRAIDSRSTKLSPKKELKRTAFLEWHTVSGTMIARQETRHGENDHPATRKHRSTNCQLRVQPVERLLISENERVTFDRNEKRKRNAPRINVFKLGRVWLWVKIAGGVSLETNRIMYDTRWRGLNFQERARAER